MIMVFFALLCGFGAGKFYFWDLRRSLLKYQERGSAVYFVFQFLFRIFFFLLLLYFVANNQFFRYLIFMAGFIVSKLLAVRKPFRKLDETHTR